MGSIDKVDNLRKQTDRIGADLIVKPFTKKSNSLFEITNKILCIKQES